MGGGGSRQLGVADYGGLFGCLPEPPSNKISSSRNIQIFSVLTFKLLLHIYTFVYLQMVINVHNLLKLSD